jgi:hypothetical protein
MACVRVKMPNGAETTLDEEFARAEGLTVLDRKPAVDSFGRDLPPKYPVSHKGGTTANTTKEK